jgi:MoaA/NifB/PqqE/SkfB family radical SAM enzyme
MNLQSLKLAAILLNPGVTRTPLKVMSELRKQGIKRLPDKVYDDLAKKQSPLKSLSFVREWLRGELISRHNGQWVVNSFLPPFPGTSYDRMFENLLSGRRLSPVSAYLAITGDCPFSCYHCSARKRKTGNLPLNVWLDTIAQLHKLGTSVIGFTGGEPLQREDLPALITSAAQGGSSTILFSSGAGFDAEKAQRLKAAGLWGVCISLDSLDENETKHLRSNKYALSIALAAIQTSVEAGFYTMIGSVATPEFIANNKYEEIYSKARELGVHEYRIVEKMPCGNLIDATENSLLNNEQVKLIRDFHTSINSKGRLPKVCAFNQVESPQYFGCGGGTQHMYIDYNGEVCPCDFTPLSFGNISGEPLTAIWNRMTASMENPRRNCFMRKNYKVVQKYYKPDSDLPLPSPVSTKICEEVGTEPLPDYFAMVTGREK